MLSEHAQYSKSDNVLFRGNLTANNSQVKEARTLRLSSGHET